MAYQTTQEKAAEKCMKLIFYRLFYHLSKDVKLVKRDSQKILSLTN